MDGTAYVRIDGSPDTVREALPDLAGVDGVRLVIDGHGSPAGPPAGSTSYRARWSAGRSTGAADVLVMPVAAWGSEVHLTIRRPRSAAAVLWPGRRLSKLAASLAIGIKNASIPLATRRVYRRGKPVANRALVRTSARPRATTTA